MFETISVIGLGYIGLPTAAVIASRRKKVIGVDVNQYAVDMVNSGQIHIVEPELDILVHAAVKEGYLRAVTQPEPADAFMIAVPTPFKTNPEVTAYEPDLSYIEASCKAFAPALKRGDLVILESTSPVGTTELVSNWLAEVRPDLTFPHTRGEDSDIRVAHCPERVLPGHVVRELVENDRVIGGMTPKCSAAATSLYETFVEGECITTTARTAEMAKLTENSFRDVNIAFANELSVICDKLDIDIWELLRLANRHPRVNVLQPGPGVGGHCIAVDPWFIVSNTPEDAKIIKTARQVNDSKPAWVVNKVDKVVEQYIRDNPGEKESDVTIACLGLAFKPDIDDLRESPALKIAIEIEAMHPGNVLMLEPNALKGVGSCDDSQLEDAITSAEVIVVLVDHKQFKSEEIFKILRNKKYIVDTRGMLAKK